MRRWSRWLIPIVLAGGVVAAAVTAWRVEADVPGPAAAAADGGHPITPILSVRRVPSLLAAPIAERRLYADLDALVGLLPPDSCLVVEGPDLRFAHREDVPLVPASTAKLLTATAALEALGSEARLRTALVTEAAPIDGVVSGDVTLVGGGDPLLATADYAARFRRQPQTFTDLDALAAAVQASGVRRIDGGVVGDESRYDSARYVAGWPPRYIDQNAVGPLSALALNDGFESYPADPGGGAPLEPAPDPARTAAAVFTSLLEARGVEVVGSPRSGSALTATTELASVEAPPLVDVIGQMLRESDNNTAELLLKEVGRDGGEGTTARGATAAAALLGDGSVDLTGVNIVDGSGLALDNRVTCDALVDVLSRPRHRSVAPGRAAGRGRVRDPRRAVPRHASRRRAARQDGLA